MGTGKIVDNSSAVAARVKILWNEVVALKVSEIAGQRFMTVIVMEPQRFAGRGNLLRRMLNAANTKLTGSPINLSSNSLGVKFDDLVKVLMAALEKHKEAG